MEPELKCLECDAVLPRNAPQGLCPRCLAGMGLSLVQVEPVALPADPEILDASQGNEKARRFGDYELIEEIARGGMGVVYRARQVSLNRIVAVKLLLFGKFSSDEFVRRFRHEAEAAAGLKHPNIVTIREVGEIERQPFFSMDFVEGRDLGGMTDQIPMPGRRAAIYLKAIAEAVHYAHGSGVLHRDLKPSNILIDPNDQPHVTDFGLAKRLGQETPGSGLSSQLTTAGQVLGSPSYMPPEQASAGRGPASATSDVYGLGAILYFLLTSRPPFLAATLEETLFQLLNTEPVSPRLLNPGVARDLETICLKCLNKEPQRRYTSAGELAEELGRCVGVAHSRSADFRPGETVAVVCAQPRDGGALGLPRAFAYVRCYQLHGCGDSAKTKSRDWKGVSVPFGLECGATGFGRRGHEPGGGSFESANS